MINNRLVWYLEYNGIITAYQSGLRKEISTIDQIIILAYDTTWKYVIMKDLHDAGLRGHMSKFISKFLSNRKFSIRIGGTLYDIYNQEEGVPQGSILSVTLFSLNTPMVLSDVLP